MLQGRIGGESFCNAALSRAGKLFLGKSSGFASSTISTARVSSATHSFLEKLCLPGMTTETIVKVHPFFAKRKLAPKPPPPAAETQSQPPPPPINPLVLKSRVKPNEFGQYPKSSIPAESSTSSAKRYLKYRNALREQQRAQEIELHPQLLRDEELKLAFYGPDELWQEESVSSKAKSSLARSDVLWPDKENGHVRQLEATEYPSIQRPMFPVIKPVQPNIDFDIEKIPPISNRPDYEPSQPVYASMSRREVEKMMDKVYAETQWSSSRACQAKLDATFTSMDESDRLWADRHRPRQIQEILGNDHNNQYLQQWLQQLKVAVPKQQQKRGTFSMDRDDMSLDSSSEDNDDENDEDFQPGNKRRRVTSKRKPISNIILLVGPNGVGKTAAVYTAAEQIGYNVFELHAGVRRSGKDLMAAVGEMAESHQVSFSGTANQGRKRPKKATATKKVEAAKGSIMHFMRPRKEEPMDVDSEEQQEDDDDEAEGVSTAATPPSRAKQCLILLEDVDLLYDDDKGFWTAVNDLAQKSKRPIIMTTNDPDLIPVEGLKFQTVLRYVQPRTNTLLPYLQLLALSEGYLVNPGDLVSLVGAIGSDIRRLIHTLQVWCKHINPEPYTGGPRRTFCVCSHLFIDYMGMNNIVSLPTVERRLEITQRYTERRDQVEIDQLCWRYVRDKPATRSVKEAFAANDLKAIYNAMETASFMDAWIRPHGPEQVHVVDKDLICGYAGTYNVASASSYQAAEPVAVLNGERLENRKWQRRFHEWSGTWGDLCDMRTAFYDECTEALERLLNYRLANQPIKHIVMTEYVPRIREMCEHKSRRSRRKRHWMLDDEQVQTLVRERKFHDETRLWCAQAEENAHRWNSIGLKIL